MVDWRCLSGLWKSELFTFCPLAVKATVLVDFPVDDFEGVDLKNKAVVSFLGAPWELDPHAIFSYDRVVGKSVHVAVRSGALLVYVSEEMEASSDTPPSAEKAFLQELSKAQFAYLPELNGKPSSGIGLWPPHC